MANRILAINPGSTSTKIAVYDDETPLFVESIEHPKNEIAAFEEIFDQYGFRKDAILKVLSEHGVALEGLTAVVSRGGLLPPVPSGAFEVNDDMIWQLHYRPENEHASNLGAPIAKSIADALGIKAYIYDPVTVDELDPVSRIAGLAEFRRKSLGHALNMRAAAHAYAEGAGRPYEELNLIVAHLGGGITLSAHRAGRMFDMVSDEEGPFSPERSGGLPVFQTLEWAAGSGEPFRALYKHVKTKGGLMGHLGTNDAREVEAMIAEGDEHAKLVYEAMALSIAKHIATLAASLKGRVDAVIVTGGLAKSKMLTEWIGERVGFIAPFAVIAGENEMESLVKGTLRVLSGQEEAHEFHKVEDL